MASTVHLRGSIRLDGSTPVSTYDFSTNDSGGRRCVGVNVGDGFSIDLGIYSDTEVVAGASVLIAALDTVRQDAIARIALARPPLSSEDAQDAPLNAEGLPDVPVAAKAGRAA